MAVRNNQSITSSRSKLADLANSRRSAKARLRNMLLEQLEQRQLLAVGPQLIGIQPNSSDLLANGDVRMQAPSELVFRFDESQVINPATLSGIRITSAGGDGTFGANTAQSDFGSNGGANIQLTAVVPGQSWTVQVTHASLAPSAPPTVAVSGSTIAITLNSNPAGRTTANGLIAAVNGSAALAGKLTAQLNGGLATAPLAIASAASYSPIAVNQSQDRILKPGSVLVGQSPNQNEVTFRFAETLKDDNYRIEIFGFDDPPSGVVGLRNTAGAGGELFTPSVAGTRKDTVDFRLDLGPQVTAVVPQPVVRVGSQLQQQRDTIVVYFDNDKLLVENGADGKPTARSVENPGFYQLIFTHDTVRNTDDITLLPTSVKYNAATNTATLKFGGDLNDLAGPSASPATYRLRIGTRETLPAAPTRVEGRANVITDLNTQGAVKLRLTSKDVGESAGGIRVNFSNSKNGTPSVTAVGKVVSVDMGRDNLTAAELVTLLSSSSASAALFTAELEPGSIGSTVVGNTNLAFSPVTLVGLGSSFDTASDLGSIGSAAQVTTSVIVSSAIDPQTFNLDLPGASDDPGHRRLVQNLQGGFEDHVNQAFGPDAVDGISTIYYNFQSTYAQSTGGQSLGNAISEEQKIRAREVISLWAKYIGVQFVETSDLGLTIAAGQVSGLRVPTGTTYRSEGAFGVAIDPSFQNPLIVLSANLEWGLEYGASYTRNMAAAVGIALGLEHAGDLPESTLLRLDPTFLAGSGPLIDVNDNQLNASDEKYEPIVPGNQDILHARHLYRPDGSDIDLYRFEVGDRVGILTAETYAQRLSNSSPLNTHLQLFQQQQASATTTLGANVPLSLYFEAVRSGAQGNQLQIYFTQTERGDASKPTVLAYPNALSIDLNATQGSESTVQDIMDAIDNSFAASSLVRVRLVNGAATTKVGDNLLSQNPVTLVGGGMRLISQNDDYFGRDSLITQSLGSGVYYLGVSASGNADYNASIAGTGIGGHSEGSYDLRLTFRAAVDASHKIQGVAGTEAGAVSVEFDGDSDGLPGGNYNFWFQTRPLQRSLDFNAGANTALEGRTVTVTGSTGVTQVFEFSSDATFGAGRVSVPYTLSSSAGDLANALATVISSRSNLGVSAVANGVRVTLGGERTIAIDPQLKLIDVGGKTIFVDKSAGPNADGSLAKPFNNISGSGVPNAFSSTFPGDIVRIVGNGGADGNLATEADNFAYEIGTGLLPGSVLSDGLTMEIPKGVTTMIDAGAVFKLREARIGVGSSNLGIDRSGGALQVLGAPVLVDSSGNALRKSDGTIAAGRVYFTSWLDESIGFDAYTPTTTPGAGNWGGISFRNDVDSSAGRHNLESEGIFLQYINNADIRYGGGTVMLDSNSQTIYPIQMIDVRPTITDNLISRSSSAAMSAAPNSFEETNFNEPRFQQNGSFTSDYDRVGPEIRRNTLANNSLNGLFIRVDQGLTVPARFDDIDIVHVLTDNLTVHGAAGGELLDSTTPPIALVTLGPNVGGKLTPGFYNYKVTYIDRNGYESVPSDVSMSINLTAGQTAISVAGLPGASGDFVERKLYRSQANGVGPYVLVSSLDRTTSTFLDIGKNAGGTLTRDRADVSGVGTSALPGGTLAAGIYTYRVVMVDAAGREGLASNPTTPITLAADGSVRLDNLPLTLAGYVSRRIYRSSDDGSSPYVLVGELSNTGSASVRTFTDTGSNLGRALAAETLGVKRPRVNASLVIDPGSVIKLESSRIEASFGANIIAEGTVDKPIVFTSKLDDTVGAGGTFDTNNNGSTTGPAPRDWGGIYVGPTSTLSVDYARFAYGGGVTKLDSTFRAFNTIEINQADARIAHTLFENNADGFGGQGPGTRFGRLSNEPSTIFVRGAQPTIIDNIFRGNAGSAITIDVNSMTADLKSDPGRQTGDADRNPNYLANRGPLIRENRFDNNGLNGLKIRGDTLTTSSVWDDTDIVHVVYDEIFTGNVQHVGGLRLQSAPNESLVVKFDGYGSNFNRNIGAGITANGQLTSAPDRIGGTLHIVGQPGFPVILTSLFDDTVGAGLRPDGQPQNDTNNDGIGSVPQAADWRGILLDQYSNDRNVAIVLETESFTAAAPGPNGITATAQVLGTLASSRDTGDETRRIGFVVEGVLSQNEDIDVYSFTGTAGSEVWFDIDYTQNNVDLVLELLNPDGELLARSNSSTDEAANSGLLYVSPLLPVGSVNPLATRTVGGKTTSSGAVKEDGTTNPLDPGFRMRLPGSPGNLSTFFVRVRSASTNVDAAGAGLTSGAYQLQVRLREQQEWAGSSVNYADIRYAMNGVHLRGLPGESPLIGEAAEDESVRTGQTYANNGVAIGGGITGGGGSVGGARVGNQIGNRPQYVGNLLETAKGAISIAGNISSGTDVDFYMLEIKQTDIVGSMSGGYSSVVFDMDYADGLNRPDTSLNIFREVSSPTYGTQYQLVYSSDASNIADDQGRPLSITDVQDLSRGSMGTKDPFIGPIALPEGIYLVGVSSAGFQPRALANNPSTAPIPSIRRIVDENYVAGVTGATAPEVANFLPRRTVGPTGELVSKTFDLGRYSAADLPAIYLGYTRPAASLTEFFIRDSSGTEFAIASSNDLRLAALAAGTGSLKLPLGGITVRTSGGAYLTGQNFAGQDGLSLILRSADATTRIDSIIIGFGERGESVVVAQEGILLNAGFITAPIGSPATFPPGSVTQTRQFSLQTYNSFFDRPQVAFDYQVTSGQMDVYLVDTTFGFPIERWLATTVATGRPGSVTLLTTGTAESALLDISSFAGRTDLRIEFRARNDATSQSAVRNVVIQLRDGSRVGSGEFNSTYVSVAVPTNTVTSGNYQMEIRLGDEFFQSRSSSTPIYTKSFDTNDRLANTSSLVAPAGNLLTSGDQFSISDGGRLITFEFTTSGAAGLGNVPVRFAVSDPAYVVARAIRDAINSSGVQSQLQGSIRAASSNGIVSGTAGRDPKVDLHGPANFKTISAANAAGAVKLVSHSGISDRNVRREQGQILIQNSFIRQPRDYGVWSEPAARLPDPRDTLDSFTRSQMQEIPNMVGTQAVRNLPVLNDGVQGGMLPGLVVQNNVLEEGGLGGIKVQGETPMWMLSPKFIPYFEPGTDSAGFLWDGNPLVNTTGATTPISHFGSYFNDENVLVVDADRTRIRLEFDDLAGGATGNPVRGSGRVEGDGVSADSSVAWYRDTGGDFYQRLTCTNCTAFATTAFETMHALRDSLLSSILVSNGTTQQVNVTIAESLLGPDPVAPEDASFGYPLYFNRPAVYIEGATQLQWQGGPNGTSNPLDIRQLDLGEAPQPQAKIVNNTIIGTDGRASFNGESALNEPNDTLAAAVQTWQGTAHNPLEYTSQGFIGDAITGQAGADVDIYQFKLGVGERVIVNVDSPVGGTLDAVLQIFDSRGIAQVFTNATGQQLTISNNDPAPGEALSFDPYADFTATAAGVYYAAVSSVGNVSFDPLSYANRQVGDTTGDYSISVSARHLQEFVITAQDASAYSSGDTFTVFGVPDIGSTGSSGRTFEFVIGGGGASSGNIPININPDWRFPDVARAIAKAINEGGAAGGRAIPNTQSLPNGIYGTASPLPPVHAKAIGGLSSVLDAPFNTIQGDKTTILRQLSGVDELGTNQLSRSQIEQQIFGPYYEVNQGLELFPRRNDGFLINSGGNVTSLSHLGMGHDRQSTSGLSSTSRGDGTSEKFVLVSNAAWINGNNAIIVDPDQNGPTNLDQLLPETGVLASRGASPTVLNNVFFNLQTPVINEESRRNLNTNSASPYGSPNPNVVSKPGEVIVGGSVYQYYETATARNRFATGVETSPTNVPNTSLDQNIDVPGGVRLFVNAQAGEYLPAPGSPLIDSAINKLDERPSLVAIKNALGIPVSPVQAPDYDLVGQLRADDPSSSPAGGTGQNIFKDRGAFDRADFIGPAAILLDPIDNDALGIDGDGAVSVVQLKSGVYPQFRIQLADGNEPSNPLRGIGVDDDTVVNSVIPGERLNGAALVIFENGRLLREGIDYSFAYNATRDEIILTPLAGVWKQGKVYEISINNQDRFVIAAPSGDQIADGDRFTITDEAGGVVTYEFESGYRLQVPQGLTLQIPLAGGAFGGIVDGDRFSLTIGGVVTTFEFDRNSNVLAGNNPIPYLTGATQQEIQDAVVTAITAAGLSGVSPAVAGPGQIFIGAEAGAQLATTFSTLTQPNGTLALRIPDKGPRGGVFDGHTFTLNDGRQSLTFEYDTNATVTIGNVAIDFSQAATAADIAILTRAVIAGSGLNFKPTVIAGTLIHLGMGPTASASTDNSQLTLVGVARTLADGEKFTITGNGKTATFEITRDAIVTPGNIAIMVAPDDSQSVTANRIVAAIIAADLGLAPEAVGPGNIALGGTASNSVDVTAAPGLTLFGLPGVESNTRLQVFGPLVLQVPAVSSLADNSTIAVRGNGRTVIFEFDGNFSGPSAAGNVVVRFSPLNSPTDVAAALATAITDAGLGIAASSLGDGKVSLGRINANRVLVGTSGLTATPGVVSDGETFTINNGQRAVTFEFNNVDLNNGFDPANTQIQFSGTTTPTTLINTMKAAIEGAGLGLTTTVMANATLQLNDTPRFTTNVSGAPTLVLSGLPGGANKVKFIQDSSFTGADVKRAIIAAINASPNTALAASDRGSNSLFVSGATVISPEIDSYFLRGVADLAGNLLKPNQINDETRFTILMPGVSLDYGDAPDPLGDINGRYPTMHANDGARHVVGSVALLGSTITSDADGQPKPTADGDSGDDGVVFGSILATPGVFNRNTQTPVQVTLSSPGFVDAWIDFNADGDWNDPGEKILSSVEFAAGNLTQTFSISVPATAPVPSANTVTYARFRSRSAGGLLPTGLAVDGEVEDYTVTIAPGTPPQAVNDTYVLNEDPAAAFQTTDPTGKVTAGFTTDDGVAANDVNPDDKPLSVTLVTGPAWAQPGSFQLNPNGTFSYRPVADFNGQDTFVYSVNDGVLGSNNLGTVTLIVREVNDSPVPAPDMLTLNENAVLEFNQSVLLANDKPGPANESGQTLTITAVSATSAQGGSVTLVGGNIKYVPPANYSGSDSFTYTVTDNGTTAGVATPLSVVGTVTLSIADKNNLPVTVGKNISTNEDVPATMTADALKAGDIPGPADESGQTLTVIGVTPTSSQGGTVTFANGVATYTPAPDFTGIDTFFYQVQDNGTSAGVSDPQTTTGTVTVTVVGQPDAPRVGTPLGSVTMAEDGPPKQINLSTAFFDPDAGDSLTFSLPVDGNSNPGLVTATISAGQLVLTLKPYQNGTATIVVQATDATGLSVRDTLTLNVTSVDNPPQIATPLPDFPANENSVISPIVLSPTYFFDPDVLTNGDVLTFEVVGNTNSLLVTPTVSGNELRLLLSPNRFGFSDIRVAAKDASGQTVISQFRLTVNEVNDVPITQSDSYRVKQGQVLITSDPRGTDGNPANDGVLANDLDPEGLPLTAAIVTGPANATQFSLNADGTFTYQHDFSKGKLTDSFTYRASDGNGLSVVTTVTINIDNPPPPSHQNQDNRFDVNADGYISPIDALLIINLLNQRSGGGTTITTASLAPPPAFVDTDGNNLVTPNDVAEVITYLNANTYNSLRSGEGEGVGVGVGIVGAGQDIVGTGEGETTFSVAPLSLFQSSFASQLVMATAVPVSLPLVPVTQTQTGAEPVAQPAVATIGSPSIFAQVADSRTNGVDVSWVTQRTRVEDSKHLTDLALASLLADFGDSGDV